MKKFLTMIYQVAFIFSAFYLVACIGAEMFVWIMADMKRTVAFLIFSFYIVARMVYKEFILE